MNEVLIPIELTPNEFRRFGNMLVSVAKDKRGMIERGYADADDKAMYRDAILFMDKLGIPESEVSSNED